MSINGWLALLGDLGFLDDVRALCVVVRVGRRLWLCCGCGLHSLLRCAVDSSAVSFVQDFNRREATLCFKWARMDYSNLESLSNYVDSTHLTFPDFLEAIARMAESKTMPEESVDVIEYYRSSVAFRGTRARRRCRVVTLPRCAA